MDHQKLEKVGSVVGQEVQVAIFSYSVLFIVYSITTSDAMTTRYDSSLVPRPLPAFQCCTLKNERAWYLKSRARAILLRNKQLEKGDKTNRLFFAYGAL